MVRNWVNSKVKFNCNLIFIYIFHCFHLSFDKFSGPVRIISDLYFLMAYGLLGTKKLKQKNPRIWYQHYYHYSDEKPCNDSKHKSWKNSHWGFKTRTFQFKIKILNISSTLNFLFLSILFSEHLHHLHYTDAWMRHSRLHFWKSV